MSPAELFLSLGGPRELRLLRSNKSETHYPVTLKHVEHLIQRAEENELSVFYSLNKPAEVPPPKDGRRYPRATRNADIYHRENILIDIDTVKSGESATPQELASAEGVYLNVLDWVQHQGYPVRFAFCSGNGRAVVLASMLAATPETDRQVKGFLNFLASRFNDEFAQIDATVHDRARISRLPGTTNFKEYSHTESYLYDIQPCSV